MKNVAFFAFLGVCAVMLQSPFGESIAMAKRGAPKPVPAIKVGDIAYQVDHSHMGTVEAWDLKANKMIWRHAIYTVKYIEKMETDVQDVFITETDKSGDVIKVKNERGSEYELDLKTMKVKLIKGKLVEQLKR